jgi:transglutaminase-like putative cysteine protease
LKSLLFLLGSVALTGASAGRAAVPTPAPLPAHVLTTQFTYSATVPKSPPQAKTLDLWLPLPSDNEFQTVSDVRVDSPLPYKITREAEFGNRMVYLHSDRPQAPLALTVSFVVKRSPPQVLAKAPNAARLGEDSGAKELRRLRKPDAKVPVGGRYGRIAKTVSAGDRTSRDKAHAFFEHVVDTMQYDYKKESPKLGEGDVAFVCDYKKGNCSDIHSYLISLARSSKVPAYLEYGFPITGIPLADPIPKEGTISGYHCWTWYHDPEYGWVPIDASDARRWVDAKRPDVREYLFGTLITERSAVAFSRGRDLTLSPKQQYGPLNYFIYPYAEADGRPVDAKWDLSYKLLQVEDVAEGRTSSALP